jgi:hypothetical protein
LTAEKVNLGAVDGAPFLFEARAALPDDGAQALSLELSGPGTAGGHISRRYRLAGLEQSDFLDVFEKAAEAFGTRRPRICQREHASASTAPYRVLLDRPLSPDIWYGYGDPAVLHVPASRSGAAADCYYLVVTSNDAPNAFPLLRSTTLADWRLVGFVFPEGKTPEWAETGLGVSDYWAPELHDVGGKFLLCFTAREKGGALAIGLATASHPEGPFIADPEPLLRGGVIDAHLFVDRHGRTFLFWKEDTNDLWPSLLTALLHEHPELVRALFPSEEDQRTVSLLLTLWPWIRTLEPMQRFFLLQILIEAVVADFAGFRGRLRSPPSTGRGAQAEMRKILAAMTTRVYAQELAADMHRLVGDPVVVLENDQDWEAHLIEGIWVVEHAGSFFLFYSGNDFSTPEYGTGVAVATSPLGPYAKRAAPLLRSTAEWAGPGHPSLAPGPDGSPWLFLHAFFPGEAGYKKFRALLATPVSFASDRAELG